MKSPSVHRSLGPYRIAERLGRGGMAEVFRAYRESSSEPLALKVVLPELAREEGLLSRFRREARIASTLHHPNIVRVLDFEVSEADTYLVMEYLPGGTLRERISAQGPFPLEKSAAILDQICAALEYAHQRGIVHHDLKPENVLFAEDGRAVVTDFGLARILGQAQASPEQAPSGTLAFLAPERLRGRPGDGRSDLYSVGLVFYELVTGRRAVTGDTPLALVSQHLEVIPAAPTERLPGMPEAVEPVVLRAIAPEPQGRYQTAAELREAIAPHLPSRARRGRSPRLRWGLLATTALTTALLAWALVFGPLAPTGPQPPPEPVSPPGAVSAPGLAGTPGRIIGADPAAVRSRPGSEHPVIGQVSPGTEVRLLRREGSWYAITFPAAEGEAWIEADRILPADP